MKRISSLITLLYLIIHMSPALEAAKRLNDRILGKDDIDTKAVEEIESYIAHGGNINITDRTTKSTLMIRAVQSDTPWLVILLLYFKADVNAKDWLGHTAYECAYDDAIRSLLKTKNLRYSCSSKQFIRLKAIDIQRDVSLRRLHMKRLFAVDEKKTENGHVGKVRQNFCDLLIDYNNDAQMNTDSARSCDSVTKIVQQKKGVLWL